MMNDKVEFIDVGSGAEHRRIAVRADAGETPGVFWLGGFNSDMKGTKAQSLAAWAQAQARACVRFDYSGHGESGGTFRDGTIGRWLEESLAVFTRVAAGPQIVVGSSMGGWMALLLSRELKRRAAPSIATIAGMVLIAPAVDFTEALMWKRFSPEIRREVTETGEWQRPSDYAEQPTIITRALIEEGRTHLLLDGLIEIGCASCRASRIPTCRGSTRSSWCRGSLRTMWC
jgi:pimeloyl-ACP methyl ester carboxylesterase